MIFEPRFDEVSLKGDVNVDLYTLTVTRVVHLACTGAASPRVSAVNPKFIPCGCLVSLIAFAQREQRSGM